MDTAEARRRIERWFPQLNTTDYNITSPIDRNYNCIAWAAGVIDEWWWPDEDEIGYWPASVPRSETLSAFTAAFSTLGYEACDDGSIQAGHTKIAIYVDPADTPTHVARQNADGTWTSKLGMNEDITHTTPHMLGGGGNAYGSVVRFMKRPE